MNLNEFIEKTKEDSNLFWRLSSGEHQNLLDEAIEKLEIAETNKQSGGAVVSHIEVQATLKFIRSIGLERTAEFMVNQQKAIDGLNQNNESFRKTYIESCAD